MRGAFNKFPAFFFFFVQAFKIVVDSWKFSMLWDDWPIFMISGSNEQLKKKKRIKYQRKMRRNAG